MDGPYIDRWDHLGAELCRLEAWLRRLDPGRDDSPGPDAAAEPPVHWPLTGSQHVDPEALADEIACRVAASRSAGVRLPLVSVADEFGLSAWELLVVLLCLATEIEPGYERVYAWLQGEAGRCPPTVELALRFLGDDLAVRSAGRIAFAERSALHRAGVTVADRDPAGRALSLDPDVVAFVLGDGPSAAHPWATYRSPNPGLDLDSGSAPGPLAGLAVDALDGQPGHPPLVICLHGGGQPAARAVAEEVCAAVGAALVAVDLPLLVAAQLPFGPAVRAAMRDAALRRTGVLFTRADQSGDAQAAAGLRLSQLAQAAEDLGRLVFVGSRYPLQPDPPGEPPWLMLEASEPSLTRRADHWRAALAANDLHLDASEADSLAARYRLAGSELDAVVATSRLYARARGGNGEVTFGDVEAASRSAAGRGLFGLAQRISPRYGWADIVLPGHQRWQLEEIVTAVHGRRKVLDEWGFGAKLSRGLGLSALFSGPPGTGKTMSAEIIARELGLDLYTVDLATVVSKYIGETEENLSRIFDAGEATHALLFFDEADALFGKRSEVKDAHDRYANIEISYLLQRIETYSGLVVLATNLRRNLDDAFLRRLNVVVDFPFPGTAERGQIWQAVLPQALPVAGDVDWDFLAGRFAIAGGAIKGAVLHAAYQAAGRGGPVDMAGLVQGVRRELDKTGKVSIAGDFEPYAHLLREG